MGAAKRVKMLLIEQGKSVKDIAAVLDIAPQSMSNKLYRDSFTFDEVVKIDDDVAIKMVKTVAETEGLPIGISAGAAVTAAVKLAERDEFVNKRLVVVLPDGVERYLSTGYF